MFGAWLALLLRRRHRREVVLLERESAIMRRASYNNQARVHNGYHYPRSILTGLRSRVNSSRFLSEFSDCVYDDFQMYYGISRLRSNVTASQFTRFCERIGAPLEPADDDVSRLFESSQIEAVFKAREFAFDADKLARRLTTQMAEHGVEVRLRSEADRVVRGESHGPRLLVSARKSPDGEVSLLGADFVFNCTYSHLNLLLDRSGLPSIHLKHELAEMALVEVAQGLEKVGVTIMCGPFFSFMPFPPLGLHTFSHVRYTPHRACYDRTEDLGLDANLNGDHQRSQWDSMRRDAARLMPIVGGFRQKGSLWELKTVLPQSEGDDSRPILFKRDAGLPGLSCVLGGKIDNVYDMEREVEALLSGHEG